MNGELVLKKSSSKIMFWPWIIFSLGAIYYCYEYFLRISPSIITGELMHFYHLNGAEVGNLSAFYYHAYVPMQIVVGLLMDRYGPRRLLTVACLLCAVGTYFFAAGYSLAIAETGRFLVGFGSSFAFVGALKLASIWLPPKRFAFVSGVITCLGMLGGMMGDILLRTMVDKMGWQMSQYAAAVLGIALAALLWLLITDKNQPESTNVIHLHETQQSFKRLIKGLWQAFKNPQIWFVGMIGSLLYLSLSSFAEMWGIAYLEQSYGLSKMDASKANALIFLGWAIGGPWWGWLSAYVVERRFMILFSSLVALVLITVILYFPHLAIKPLYFLLFLFGVFSSVQILVFALGREMVSFAFLGTTVALINMIVMLSGNIFQPVIGMILDHHWTGIMIEGARFYNTQAYQLALSVIPISLLLTMVITFFVRESKDQKLSL